MEIFLFPQRFKLPGIVLLCIGFIGIWIATSNGLINVYRIIAPSKMHNDGGYPYPSNFWEVNKVFQYISMAVAFCGFLFVLFSKEKDEFFKNVRSQSLQFASITMLGLTICAIMYTFFARSETVQNLLPAFVGFNVSGFWILFILHYLYKGYFSGNFQLRSTEKK